MATYRDIAADLREQIASGSLTAGQRLPSVATLRARYGTSHGTAQNAVRLLATEGWIVTEKGRETRVADSIPPPATPLPTLAQLAADMADLRSRVERLEQAGDQ